MKVRLIMVFFYLFHINDWIDWIKFRELKTQNSVEQLFLLYCDSRGTFCDSLFIKYIVKSGYLFELPKYKIKINTFVVNNVLP